MIVGFTAAQAGMTYHQKSAFIDEMNWLNTFYTNKVEFHHGDCINGDADADLIVQHIFAWPIVIHPPIDESKRAFCMGPRTTVLPAKDYLPRDHDIVNVCSILIAAPSREEYLRSGTWATIRYAVKKERNHTIIMRDGTLRKTRYS